MPLDKIVLSAFLHCPQRELYIIERCLYYYGNIRILIMDLNKRFYSLTVREAQVQ